MYPPCVFVYAKSVGSWMPLGHIHIQLYNETFIVHANRSTSTNQLKHMAYTHGFMRFGHIKLSQLRSFYLKCLYQARKASGHVYVC